MERVEREIDLRRRILRGDRSAWREVYDDTFDSLWVATCRRLGGDSTRAEDVVQEAWMVAVRRIRRFDPHRGSFRAWIHGIAEMVVRNHERRRRRRSRGEPAREAPLPSPSHEARLDLRELVAACWASLPPHYRDVLREKYVEELTVNQIAERRERSPKAIESLLTRARLAFRDAYGLLGAGARDGG